MTVHGRFTGIVTDELSHMQDSWWQRMGGLLPDTVTPKTVRANIFRQEINTDLAALTTQVMLSVAVYLRAGDVVKSLTFKSGATAADTPTNWWFALYDPTGAKLSQTADQTNTAWAANTAKTLDLAATQTITSTGFHFAGIMVKATTPPSLLGKSLALAGASAAWITGEVVLAQTSGSALTATAPATIASPTAVANMPRVLATS